MRDQQGFTDFATARAGDLRRQAYLLTGSPERAVRLADKALAETGRRWDRLGGAVAAEEHARRVVATGSLRGRGVTPAVALTSRGTAAPTDDAGEAVRRALAGLPPRRRVVLVLRYDEGLDDAAVGARLGLPPAQAAAEGEAGLVTLRSLLRRRGRPEDLLPTALAETPLPVPLSPPPHPVPIAGGEPAGSDNDTDAPAAAAGNSVAPAERAASSSVPAAPLVDSAADVSAADAAAMDASPDTSATDAPTDASPTQALAADAPATDASTDAGAVDAGTPDSGVADARMADARMADSGVADSGVADAGVADSGVADAGVADARVAEAPVADAPAADVRASDAPAAGPGVASALAADGVAAGVRSGSAGDAPASSSAAEKTGAPGRGGSGKAAASRQGRASSQSAGGPAARTDQKPGRTAQKPGGRPPQRAGEAAPETDGASRNGAGAAARPAGVAAAAEAGTAKARAAGRRRWLIAAVVVVVAGIGAAILVPALRGDSTADGPVPAASGSGHAQLPWTVRGPLAGDQDLLRSALRAWQSGVPDRQRPTQAAALWAGDLDGVRTVVLQGTDGTGQTWVAHVVGSGDTASLRSAEPLGRAVPLLAIGTTAGAVRLLADPDTPPNGVLAGIGDSFRPLAVAQDSLTQGVTVPSDGLQVVLTDDGAVVRSGTVLPGRLSPVTGTVELTRPTLDLGPTQPPAQTWYVDGQLIGRRLGGPVELVQAGPVRSASIRVNGRPTKVEVRGYEVVRGGTRYLATVVRSGGAPTCTDTTTVGPADSVPAKPVALVARCIPRGSADGVLAAVGTRGVRSVRVTLAPATPAVMGRPGVAPRPAQPARTVTVTGTSGSGLVALTAVSRMPTSPASAVARDAGNHQLARVTLPAYKTPRP
ncbi:MAG TPA: hypothetical protein VH573_15515 [Mycobacteriales bacterium]